MSLWQPQHTGGWLSWVAQQDWGRQEPALSGNRASSLLNTVDLNSPAKPVAQLLYACHSPSNISEMPHSSLYIKIDKQGKLFPSSTQDMAYIKTFIKSLVTGKM